MAAPFQLNQNQIPDNSILDAYNKQVYLGKAFIAATPVSTTAGTSEVPILLLSNPIANKTSMFAAVRKFSCQTTGVSILFRVYINPTITSNGTTITPVNLRINPNSPTSVMTAFLSPTASSNGTYVTGLPVAAFSTAISNVLQILDPGASVLITAQASSAGTSLEVEQVWYEL